MPWIKIIPSNSGGGRKPQPPSARLNKAGQMHVTLAAAEMLGMPPRVRLEIEPEQRLMRLYPATDGDAGAFSLSGGGNTPHRLHAVTLVKKYPQMIGAYNVRKLAGGIELYKE